MTRKTYKTPELTVELFEEKDIIYASDIDDDIDPDEEGDD